MWLDYVPIALAILIPATGISLAVIRYFWNKEKCFLTMKNKIDELSKHDVGASEDHDGYEERLAKIETNQQKWIIYLKLLLKDRNIPYDE